MNDDVKKALEEIEQTFDIVHRVATHQSNAAYMSIPANPKRDADLRHMAAVEALRAHIDAEPARLAAAREEQREADVRSCPTCKGEGYTMRVRECPFCSDSTHDHECPTDEVKVYCACGAAHIRDTPLTATPQADRIAELERQNAGLLQSSRATYEFKDSQIEFLVTRAEKAEAERDAALARVKELEEYSKLADADAEGEGRRADALEKERDALEAHLAEAHERLDEFGARRDGQTATLVEGIDAMRGRLLDYRRWANEAEEREGKLKAQLAEAVGVLRAIRRRATTPQPGRWVDNVFHPQPSESEVRAKRAENAAADAVLAKYPEG